MQRKKKNSGRNGSQELGNSKVSRTQRKVSESSQVTEKNVSELIASSARKQARAEVFPKKSVESKYCSLRDETSGACLAPEATKAVSCKSYHELSHAGSESIFSPSFHISKHAEADMPEEESIFSPSFHISKHAEADMPEEVAFIKFFQSGDQKFHRDSGLMNAEFDSDAGQQTSNLIIGQEMNIGDSTLASIGVTFSDDVYCTDQAELEGETLSSEVSAIYLAMKNSRLECVDEHDQDHLSTEGYTQEDEDEEFDDFDPYFFIKNLPELAAVVPTYRPLLLPKQTRSCPPTTLVLDLDETLVHSTLEPCVDADFTFPVNFNLQEHTVYVRCRPYLKDFMERVSGLFEIIIFTASQSIYAEQLLNVLDPKRKTFRHRVFRESCVFVDGNYLKDLSILGRDLAHVIIVDNSPQAFGFQVDNGIPIDSWFDDRSDKELLLMLPFLESLIGVEDVRPMIARKFNTREKIAAAVYPCQNTNRGENFER